MKFTFAILFFLLMALPSALSSQCIPSNCASGCCATKDTCASDESQCNYCNPEDCLSGSCVNNKCAPQGSHPGSVVLLFALGATFVGILVLTGLVYLGSRKSIIRARRSADPQSQEKTLPVGTAVIPIVEVKTSENETGEKKGKEGHVVVGEEINNSMFMRHLKEDRQMQEQLREAAYHYYEDHGENPKGDDGKKMVEKCERIVPID